MGAIVCQQFGPLEQLELVELPSPDCGAGQVRIPIEAAGVNFVDALFAAVDSRTLRPVAPTLYPLRATASALADLAGRRVNGKLAIVPGMG